MELCSAEGFKRFSALNVKKGESLLMVMRVFCGSVLDSRISVLLLWSPFSTRALSYPIKATLKGKHEHLSFQCHYWEHRKK